MQDLSSAFKREKKKTQTNNRTKKRKRESKRRKRDSGYLSCSWKCHPGPAINHMGLWCVYLQLGASLPSTLLFSPLALRTPPHNTHTAFSSWSDLPSSASPFLPFPFIAVSVHQSFYTQNAKLLFRIIHRTLHLDGKFNQIVRLKALPRVEPQGLFILSKNGAIAVQVSQQTCKMNDQN